MSLTRPSLFARKRRPKTAVSAQSGFVLIFVLLAGLILIMTAISLVSRTTSSATSSAQESRAQAARMAAEYGFNEIMARINFEDDPSSAILIPVIPEEKPISAIPNPLVTSYSILSINRPLSDATKTCDPITGAGDNFNFSIRGKLIAGTSRPFTQVITRTIRVCKPDVTQSKLRVRSFD